MLRQPAFPFLAILCGLLIAPFAMGADDAKPLPGNVKLLKDYKHEALQGIDSVVGKIVRADGFTVQYEIGAIPKPGGLLLGGSFSNRAATMRPELRTWYKEQATAGGTVHIAMGKDGMLTVSVPEVGANLHAKPKTPEDTIDVILLAVSMKK